MDVVDWVDYPNRRIYLGPGSFTNPNGLDTMDVYREVRALRRLHHEHRRFEPLIRGEGNIQVLPDEFTPRFVILESGVFLVPYNTTHRLIVKVAVYSPTDLRKNLGCFDRNPIASSSQVDIVFDVPQVEIRVVNTGSALTATEAAHLFSLGTPQQNADTLLATQLP